MVKIAALLMVIGTGCHLEKPKSWCTRGVWIASILAATSAVFGANGHGDSLRWVVICSVLAMLLFAELGLWHLLKEIDKWSED